MSRVSESAVRYEVVNGVYRLFAPDGRSKGGFRFDYEELIGGNEDGSYDETAEMITQLADRFGNTVLVVFVNDEYLEPLSCSDSVEWIFLQGCD